MGFYERSCISVLLLYSVVYVALYVINERAIHGSSWQKSISVAMSTSSAITFALAFVAYIMRWFAIQRAWNLVIADKERYDSLWQSIIHSPNSAEWLTALQDEVSKSSQPSQQSLSHLQFHSRVSALKIVALVAAGLQTWQNVLLWQPYPFNGQVMGPIWQPPQVLNLPQIC